MATYIALVRGINVGGHTKVSMSDLKAAFEGLGFGDVRTYVNSGNVVFTSSGKPDAPAIERAVPLHPTVVLRSAAQLARIVERNPFGPDDTHVTFFVSKPPAAQVKELPQPGRERFHAYGTELYLHMPDGYGRGTLTNPFLERKLGVRATTRNWRTVLKLLELAD